MPYSRRQKQLASTLFQKSEKKDGEEIKKEHEKTLNLMKMERQCVRGWWKVQYYDKKTSCWTDSVSILLSRCTYVQGQSQTKLIPAS